MVFSYTRTLALAGLLGLIGQTAIAATLQNGDFENGLDGYTVTNLSAPAVTPLATLGTHAGNTFLKLEARPVTGGFGVNVTQSITIDAQRPLLSFDAAVMFEEILFNGTPNNNNDAFAVSLTPAVGNSTTVFLIDARSTTSSFISDLGASPKVTPAAEDIFGTTLSAFSIVADLSDFAGQSLTMNLTALNGEPFVTQTVFAVDNLRFDRLPETPAMVPLPASAVLLLGAVGALARLRKRAA